MIRKPLKAKLEVGLGKEVCTLVLVNPYKIFNFLNIMSTSPLTDLRARSIMETGQEFYVRRKKFRGKTQEGKAGAG